MPDRSLVLFGSSLHSSGQNLRAGVIHVDSLLQTEYNLDPLSSGPLVDFGSIRTAAPTRNVGEFVAAIPAIARGLDVNHPERPGVLSDFKRGGVLKFINLE